MVTNYGRFKSIYEQNHNEVVKKGDYVVPAKGQNNMRKLAISYNKNFEFIVSYEFTHHPNLFNATKLGRDLNGTQSGTINRSLSMCLNTAGQTVAKNIVPTQHWISNYKNVVNDTTNREKLISRRPLWSINRQAYSSSRGIYKTEFQDQFGNHGHNPRDILPHDAER